MTVAIPEEYTPGGDGEDQSGPEEPFWARITAYDGSKFYDWVEADYTSTDDASGLPGSFYDVVGGRYGGHKDAVACGGSAIDPNGEVIPVGVYVRLIRAALVAPSADDPLDWVYLVIFAPREAVVEIARVGPEALTSEVIAYADGTFAGTAVNYYNLSDVTLPYDNTWNTQQPCWAIAPGVLGASFTQTNLLKVYPQQYNAVYLGLRTGGPYYVSLINSNTGLPLTDTSAWSPASGDPTAPITYQPYIVAPTTAVLGLLPIVNFGSPPGFSSSPTDFSAPISVTCTGTAHVLVRITGYITGGSYTFFDINDGGTTTQSFISVTQVQVLTVSGVGNVSVTISVYPFGVVREDSGTTYIVKNPAGTTGVPGVSPDWQAITPATQNAYQSGATYDLGDYVQQVRPTYSIYAVGDTTAAEAGFPFWAEGADPTPINSGLALPVSGVLNTQLQTIYGEKVLVDRVTTTSTANTSASLVDPGAYVGFVSLFRGIFPPGSPQFACFFQGDIDTSEGFGLNDGFVVRGCGSNYAVTLPNSPRGFLTLMGSAPNFDEDVLSTSGYLTLVSRLEVTDGTPVVDDPTPYYAIWNGTASLPGLYGTDAIGNVFSGGINTEIGDGSGFVVSEVDGGTW